MGVEAEPGTVATCQPLFFRIVSRLLAPVSFDTATTRSHSWTSEGAPWATVCWLSDGFALALGRREVMVSRR